MNQNDQDTDPLIELIQIVDATVNTAYDVASIFMSYDDWDLRSITEGMRLRDTIADMNLQIVSNSRSIQYFQILSDALLNAHFVLDCALLPEWTRWMFIDSFAVPLEWCIYQS